MWIAHLDSFLLSYFSLCQVSSFWGPLQSFRIGMRPGAVELLAMTGL